MILFFAILRKQHADFPILIFGAKIENIVASKIVRNNQSRILFSKKKKKFETFQTISASKG